MITALVLSGLVVYLSERFRPLLIQRLQSQRPQKSIELPSDLKMIVMGEREGWARQDSEQRFRELYADLGNWDAVREMVMVNGSATRR